MVEAKGNLKRDILKCSVKREQHNGKVLAKKKTLILIYHDTFSAVILWCLYKYGALIASAFAIDFHYTDRQQFPKKNAFGLF